MSGRTHRELAVGSHLISERWREGEKETKAGKTKDRERENGTGDQAGSQSRCAMGLHGSQLP